MVATTVGPCGSDFSPDFEACKWIDFVILSGPLFSTHNRALKTVSVHSFLIARGWSSVSGGVGGRVPDKAIMDAKMLWLRVDF